MNPTNWPDPTRPGWPPNPERDGLYALHVGSAFMARHWSAVRQFYTSVPGWPRGMSPFEASAFDFAGEIVTPAQINELLAAERERCARATEKEKPSMKDASRSQSISSVFHAISRAADAIRNLGDVP